MKPGTSPSAPTRELWQRLKASGTARASLLLLIPLLVCALGADLIANDRPYTMVHQGERYFPAFRGMLVDTGLVHWPQPLLGVDFSRLPRSQGVFAPIPYRASGIDLMNSLTAPSSEHVLGTDKLGRDIAAGMVHGARISLTIGVVAVGIAAVIGILLGAVAGYFGGLIDLLVNRLFELMMAIPTFFLIITISAFVREPSIFYIMAVIGFTGWVGIARFTRNEFARARGMDYVTAAEALGAKSGRIMFRHILPNAMDPIIVSVVFGIAGAILVESGLSFLGIGVPADVVTWGSILNEARGNTFAWWLAVFPGCAIFLTVLSYNLLGEALRDALDPRLRGHLKGQ
ncbi:MAG: ABC transporter permease [Nitrospirota bacterium]|nr:ABC transporter permease [Nitrospirota bacterium]